MMLIVEDLLLNCSMILLHQFIGCHWYLDCLSFFDLVLVSMWSRVFSFYVGLSLELCGLGSYGEISVLFVPSSLSLAIPLR